VSARLTPAVTIPTAARDAQSSHVARKKCSSLLVKVLDSRMSPSVRMRLKGLFFFACFSVMVFVLVFGGGGGGGE
jgi:hypothetical protein